MPKSIVIYDAEYWTDKGCMRRNWSGLNDHIPYLIQFSAIKVSLTDGLPEIDKCNIFIDPVDKWGNKVKITKYFSDLTNITQKVLDSNAVAIPQALAKIKAFAAEDLCYSYGCDEREIAESCYIWKQQHPLDPQHCRDARKVLNIAGMSEADINANSSGSLARLFNLDTEGHIHDASYDSLSILLTFRHFMQQGKMSLNSFK